MILQYVEPVNLYSLGWHLQRITYFLLPLSATAFYNESSVLFKGKKNDNAMKIKDSSPVVCLEMCLGIYTDFAIAVISYIAKFLIPN